MVVHIAPDAEIASAALAVRVGSRSETSSWSGLAHLAEHVACGAETPGAAALAAVGGTCNAVTQPDFTLYHGSVDEAHGRVLLDRLVEVLGTGGATADRIHGEVTIVTDELSAAVDGAVMGGFPWLWLPAALYDEPEFAHNGYGDLRSLGRVTPEVLAAFFARHYVADNAALAVAAADPGPLLEHLASARWPRGPARCEDMRLPLVTAAGPTSLPAPGQPHQATAVAWSLPYRPLAAGHLSSAVLADVLVGPDDGVLDDALSDALEVAAYVGPFADPWGVAAPLPFVVEVHHEADQDPMKVSAAVLDVLTDRTLATTDDELVAAAVGRLGIALRQRLADPVEQPQLAAAAELVHDGVERLAAVPAALTAVRPADVRAAATDLVGSRHRVLTRGPRP